jgi:hypothetical protein
MISFKSATFWSIFDQIWLIIDYVAWAWNLDTRLGRFAKAELFFCLSKSYGKGFLEDSISYKAFILFRLSYFNRTILKLSGETLKEALPPLKETLKGPKRIRSKYILYKCSKYAVSIYGPEMPYYKIVYRRLLNK